MNFINKTIVVAGANGGIGSAICKLLAEEGAKVVLLGRDKIKLEALALELKGDGHCCYACDFSDINTIEPLATQVIMEQGAIDGFVHSAGSGAVRPLKMSKYTFMKEMMDINFFSFVELVRCFTKKGSFNPGMNIVAISSVGAQYGRPTRVAYAASKGAMDAAIRCMAIELHEKHIRVNAIAPGATITKMTEDYADYAKDTDAYRLNLYRQYLGNCLPEDIAYAVEFLLSERSRKITGTIMNVDGGKMSS